LGISISGFVDTQGLYGFSPSCARTRIGCAGKVGCRSDLGRSLQAEARNSKFKVEPKGVEPRTCQASRLANQDPLKRMILSSMILSASLLMPNRPDGKDRIIFLVDVPRSPGRPGPANLKSSWLELGAWNSEFGTWSLELILNLELCPLTLHPHCPLRCQARPFGR